MALQPHFWLSYNVVRRARSDGVHGVHGHGKPGGFLLMLEMTDNEPMRTGFIFGALPQWWSGADDGRVLSPCVTPLEWHRLLCETGFSGVDSITADLDRLPYPASVMLSQAVDSSIVALNEPLTNREDQVLEPLKSLHLVILGGDTLDTCILSRLISRILSPKFKCISSVSSIGLLDPSTISKKTVLLSITELDRPIFTDMNDGSFGILKALFENSNCVLWYTSGCRADNPHANMIRGFGRSLLWELPDLRIQFLDLEDSDLSDMDATKIAHEALQFCLSIVMQDKGMLKNVLWSIEPEIVRRQNRTLIPRIKPNEQQNKRFNSKRRKISAEIDPRQTCIELCHDAQGFSLNQRHSLNIFDSAKEDLVNVDSSSISALRLNSECSGFLVFGQHLQSEEWVLGFSRTNASKVHIEAGLRTPVRSADVSGTFLSQVTALIVHERILSQARPGSTLLIHGPDRSLARLIEKACEVGHLRCLFTTTDNSKVTGTSWKLLHPFSRSMSLKQFVPLDTSVFVDLSTDHTEKQMGLALRNLLPQGCKKYDSSLFLAESSFALHHQEYQASLKMLLERAIQAVEADKVSRVSTHLFSINEISKIPPQDLPPVAVMTWNTAEEPTCTAIIRPFDSESLFRSDRTYWLIGLTGDLGLSLCKYMHDKGAKNIVLSSRSPNVDARWLAEMRTHGAVVTIVACDVTDLESLSNAYGDIAQKLPPIAGVVQGAMVLHDTPIRDMTFELFQKVLRPKVLGSINLNQIFHQPDLDFFIYFSSMTGVVGNIGQANYTTANSFMMSQAAQRRKNGLSGSVINIGAIIGVGYVTRELSQANQDNLFKGGYTFMSEPAFHQAFSEAIVAGRPGSRIDPEISTGLRVVSRTESNPPVWVDNPRFSHHIIPDAAEVENSAVEGDSMSINMRLQRCTTFSDLKVVIFDAFSTKLCSLLRMELNNSEDRAQIMAKRTDDFGIDSLVAVEIRTWFLKTLGVNVPVLKILGGAIIEDIVIYAAEKVDPGLIPNMGNPDVATLPLVATQTPMTKADHPKPSPIPDKDAEQSIKLSWTPRNESSYPDQVDSATGSSTNNPSITRSSPDSVVDGSCQTSRSSGSSGLKALVSFDPSDSRNLGNSHDMPFNTRTNARSPPSQTSYITKGSVQGQEIRRGRLSFGQELFFFVHHFTKQSSALNHTGAFKITGSIDVEKLKKGVEAISVRHEALRTRYVYDTDQTPIQVVLDRSQLHLEIVEIGSKSDVETSFKLLASYGYKIERGETMRVLLLRNPNGASYLLLGCHHINVDGVTFKALLADLEQGYNQKPFNTPTVQFLDHANHERSDYERGRFNVDLNYWKSKFLNTPAPLPVLNLPGAHKRRPLMNYEFSRAQIQLESDLVSSIRRASTSLRATPFQFYLAAFLVLLARFTDNNEVCIGLCDANRTSPESMGAVGAYVNLVPLLLSADPNSPFSKALHQVKEEALKALSHAQVPFGLLLSELRVDRSEMFSPLFQAFIDYRLGHKQHEQFADCQLELLNFEQGRTAYDVNLDIFETEKGCTIDLMLQKSLYTDHDAQILSEAYRALVIAFSTDTHQAIGVPSLFSLRDISKAITVGTGPVKHSEWPDSIMGRIQNICSRFPYNIAVTDGLGSTLTYNQLSTRTNSISHTLMSSGVHVGTRVGVFQHPTTDWICSLLAIWSLGAVYVPLDLSIPSARLAKMVQDSEPSVVLTSEETFEQVDDVVGDWILTINVDNVSTSWNRPIKLEIDPKAVCAIFYTSGSTGIPKGIALTTENIRDEIEFAATSYGIEREKVLQQSSLGFDMSLTQILCALAFGGSLHMMLFEARGDPGATVKILDKEHITMTGGTPSEYQSWLQYRKLNGDSPLPSWRLAISGGEQVPRALLDSFSSLGNAELRLYNAYGPTEVTCSSHRMELDYRNHVSAYTDDRIPAGFAVPNTFTYILDDRDQPVPVGMSGQIAIGGAGVALGYTNDDALTKERFIENSHNNSPHGAEGCQTIHKTGDRGRLLTDGRLVVEGRIAGDTQVKISGGLRVDVLDIESTLIQESEGQIHEAIVTLYRDDDGVETLVLHAVCSPQVSQVDGQGYVRRLITNSSLPRFMRPSVIETVNQLPRTSSGKADRRAVADLVRITKSRNSSTSVSVLSDEQAELLHLWTATLPQLAMEQGSISQDTDFFHVGGTSMLLIALRHRIHDTFGVDLTVLDLFRSSTIKDMALLIEEHSRLVDDIKMDWRMEVALPDLGTTFPYAETSHSLPLSVVLTGATGFLGTQLLCKLLADDRIQAVYCIAVRQPRRLTRTYNTSKLKVYEGDLTLQGFGLSNQDSTMIFSAADAIIHNGADVSHLKVYPTLKQANTNSTLQLIELCAARGRKIPIHFISSAGVALWSGLEVFDERSAAEWEPPTNGFDGYTASKWVSERLLEQACDLYGLPVIIHRPSNISREGEAPDMDLFQNLLRYCSELNAVPRSPNLTGTLNLVSVQDCSRMILEAVFAPNSGRKAQYVNEIGPTNLDLSNLGGFLQGVEQRDTVIREIGLGEWVDLAERAGLNPAVAAFFRRVERDISSKVHYPKLKKNKL